MALLVPGFAQDRSVRSSGGLGVQQRAPARGVVHTTEGGWEGSMSVFRSRLASPQFMIEPWPGGRRVQLIDANRNGYALARGSGPPTNGMGHCLQVEIVGYASNTAGWSPAYEANIADALGAIGRACGIRFSAERCYGPDAGWTLATSSARQRFSEAEWARFSGWCGHQHVPRNDHWDPGGLDLPRIIALADNDDPIPDFTPLLGDDAMLVYGTANDGKTDRNLLVLPGGGTVDLSDKAASLHAGPTLGKPKDRIGKGSTNQIANGGD